MVFNLTRFSISENPMVHVWLGVSIPNREESIGPHAENQ